MYDIVGKRYWFLIPSLILIIVGLLSIPVPPRLRLGIDFTSGSTIDVTFNAPVEQAALRQEMESLGFTEATIQRTGDRGYFIRTRTLKEEVRDETGKATQPSEKTTVKDVLEKRFGPSSSFSFSSVSPRVSQETVRNALIAVVVASLGIALYILYAFRSVPHPLRWSVCAIIALIHDVLVALGLFSIAAKFFNMEIDALFMTAMLTILGYSINDTVVVFDRLRDNILKNRELDLEVNINISILETMARSLNTGLGTIFAILAVMLLGGVTTRPFMMTLLFGIAAGTYSSFAIAAQLLVVWEKKDWRTWFRRQPKLSPAEGS